MFLVITFHFPKHEIFVYAFKLTAFSILLILKNNCLSSDFLKFVQTRVLALLQ